VSVSPAVSQLEAAASKAPPEKRLLTRTEKGKENKPKVRDFELRR